MQIILCICRSYTETGVQRPSREGSAPPVFFGREKPRVSQITVQLEREKDGVHLKAEADPGITLTIDRSLLDGEG
jgi:hypothetical protein